MKKLSKYLLWAFGVAWVFQIIAGILYRKGNSMSYSVLRAVSMFSLWENKLHLGSGALSRCNQRLCRCSDAFSESGLR